MKTSNNANNANNVKTRKTRKAEAPKAEAPKAEAPKAEAPKAEAPKAEAPKAEAPKAEAPKAEAPKAEAPKKKIITAKKNFGRWYVYFQGIPPKQNVGCACKTAKSALRYMYLLKARHNDAIISKNIYETLKSDASAS
jgi:hypothetical protein